MSDLFYPLSLFKAEEVDSETANGVLSSSLPKSGERGLCRSQHITVTRVHLRHPRNKLSSRPVSVPAERAHRRGQVEENNTRNSADRHARTGHSCDLSIKEVDETEHAKVRVATNYRRTFIDTQTLRRTWDKQYKHEVSSRTTGIMASSLTDSSVDANSLSTSVPSGLSLGNTESTISTIFPNQPYTVAVRPCRTVKRVEDVSHYNPVSTVFRAPRTLQPPPGTFYKPPSGSKAKALQNFPLTNSAEEDEEDEEEEEEGDEEVELGIELEVSVDEPLEEDIGTEQLTTSPSSSPEEMGQNQAKLVYQRLRPRRLQEVEHREAHFV